MVTPGSAPRFRFLRRIGAGGMGEVWLVEDALRGQPAALKRIHTGRAEAWRPSLALKREFRAVSALRHPHIVVPYELGTDELGPYLLMEHVAGGDVFYHCRGRDTPHGDWTGRYAETQPTSGLDDAEESGRRELLDRLTASLTVHSTVQLRPTLLEPDAVATPMATGVALQPPISEAGYARLYGILPQLLSALQYVHERGFVHRDIKPTNVLVTGDGQAKLLDFGILSEHGTIPAAALGGTVAYLAPEHIRGGSPAPENDLYALGVLMYEIVTGRVPFVGETHRDVLVQHVCAPHLPVHGLARDCPAALAAVIDGLLAKDPAQRLTILGVRRALAALPAFGEAARRVEVAPAVDCRRLYERESEQARLIELLETLRHSPFRFVTLGGASGVGKSALLDWLRNAARERGLLTFDTRTRFDQRVPFNALDEWVDALAAQLDAAPGLLADPATQQRLRLAGRSFPVLGELCHGQAEPGSPHVVEVYDAVAELFASIASAERPLVLCCDDLQWADGDSVALLSRLLSAHMPHVALVASVRVDTHSHSFAELWGRTKPDLHLPLSTLSPAALDALTSELSGRHVDDLPDIASITEGNPFFATLYAHLLASSGPLEDVGHPLQHLLGLLAPESQPLRRRLLALVTVVDEEIALSDLCELSDCGAGEVAQQLDSLVFAHLLRAEGTLGPERRYECQHDLVRRGLLLHLSGEEVRQAHARLAEQLERKHAPASRRVRHLMGARQDDRAARLCVVGAEQAQAAHAHGLAAELYGIALEYEQRMGSAQEVPERVLSLRAGLAQALESAGRYRAAAHEWERVAEAATGERRELAIQHAAMTWLATSDLKRGHHALRRARGQKPEPGWRAWGGNVWAFARLLVGPAPKALRPAHVVSSPRPRLLETHDRENFLATMVGLFDPPAGVRALLRARSDHLAGSEWALAAEVDYILAYLAYYATRGHRKTGLADRYLERARWIIGGPACQEQGQLYAHEQMVLGVAGHHVGDWERAESQLIESIRSHEADGMRGTFAHQFSWLQRLQVSRHCQHVATFARTLEAFRRIAGEVDGSNLVCHLTFHETVHALMRGEPALAHAHAARVMADWPREPASYQRFLCHHYAAMPHVYEGDPVHALGDLRSALREHRYFTPLWTMFAGDFLGLLAMLEAHALVAGAPDTSRRRIERTARMAATSAPLGRHLALRAAAYACLHEGEPARALRWLVRAESLAVEVQQPIDVAVARYQRGLLTPGAEGDALVEAARAQLAAAGAHARLFDENPCAR